MQTSMSKETTLPHPLYPTATPFLIRTRTAAEAHADRDVSIYGVTFGNTSGPPLLCLHGFPQTLAIWHKVAPELAKRFNVVLMDLRGYGRSSKPRPAAVDDGDDDAVEQEQQSKSTETSAGSDGAPPSMPSWLTDPTPHTLYSKRSMAADCLTVMQQLGHTSGFHILAHDRGARVAHSLCTSPSTSPSILSALLLDITPTLSAFRATSQALATAYYHWFFLIQAAPFPETLILASPDAFAQKSLLGGVAGKGATREDMYPDAAWEDYARGFRDEDTVHAWCEDYRAAVREDYREQERDEEEGVKIKCPLGLVWGAKGVVGRLFDVRKEWEKVAVDGAVKVAKGVEAGHYIPEQAPRELLEVCEGFFSDVGVWA